MVEYEKGRDAFLGAQCLACHKFGTEGGSIGPDLTAVSSRFSRRDVLESIIEPSKVVSEQYANTMIMLTNGKIVDGRILEENPQRIVLQPNPLQPEKLEIKLQVFKEVDLPLSMPGIIIGFLLSFVLAVGAIAEAKVLGGQKVIPITHDIEIAFTYAQNWPLGSALAVLLMLVVGALVLLVLRRFDLDVILGRR